MTTSKKNYTTSDFDYVLPKELIAQYPLPERSSSRLLVVDRKTGQLQHRQFTDLLEWLSPKDLVVFNDTKVIPARLHGHKSSGGKVECLVERIYADNEVLAHVRASKRPKIGSELEFSAHIHARVVGCAEDLLRLKFLSQRPILEILEEIGEIPIPPYLERSSQEIDFSRYQTVFAEKKGAVAAPTAALHFDEPMLAQLVAHQIQIAKVTLHVGAGTFSPVRTDNLALHVMHKEYVEVSAAVCEKIQRVRNQGGNIVAIGTTVVRCLETAAQSGELKPFQGDTQLFITPGYSFRVIDKLFTNFHLPKSTLLMLVCAFGGFDCIMAAYQEAIQERYRFFSYGDAMLII